MVRAGMLSYAAMIMLSLCMAALPGGNENGETSGGEVGGAAGAETVSAPIRDESEDRFARHWRDGKAEVSGYELQLSRYGEVRRGQAVLIYVTEPFSEARRVKLDRPDEDGADHVEALKLNLVRDFQTGIYDYNTMLSSFVRTEDLSPLKTSFSSAEWCGHVYEELIFRPGLVTGNISSYFEGESGRVRLKATDDLVAEDSLLILLRGLKSAFLEPGESRKVSLLVSSLVRRLSHRPLERVAATISRRSVVEQVEVPAGSFEAQVYDIDISDGRRGVFYIDTSYPHRVLMWSLGPDIEASLVGTSRVAYWRLNGKGDQDGLAVLGLHPVVP